MARPLRIDVEDGWYHVMSRGIERRVIFLDDSFCLHFLDLLAIGGHAFIERARKWVKSVSPEHSNRFFVASRIPFDRIVSVVESVKGESFADFRDRHGDWGVAMVFYLARLHSGLTLKQIGDQVGGLAYKTVFARIKYLKKKMDKDASLQRIYEQCKKQLSIIEMTPNAPPAPQQSVARRHGKPRA